MRSNLCSKNELGRDDTFKKEPFTRDMAALLSVQPSNIPAFLDFMKQRLLPKTASEVTDLEEKTATAFGMERRTLSHAYDVAYWCVSQFAPEHDAESDDPSTIADDLIALGLTDEKTKESLITILAGLKQIIQRDLLFELRKAAVLGKCFPKLLGASS